MKEHKRVVYVTLLTAGKMNNCLSDIDEQAGEMFSRLVKQMAACEGAIRQLKEEDQMKWVARVNNIRKRATKAVNND